MLLTQAHRVLLTQANQATYGFTIWSVEGYKCGSTLLAHDVQSGFKECTIARTDQQGRLARQITPYYWT